MIEDEQRVQLPRLLQKTLSGNTFLEEARLHPGKLSPKLRMQPLSTATMILPESDPDIVMHDLVELYNQHGSCGIFRVVDIQPAYGKNRTITLNHALDVLNDAVYPSNTEEFNGTVTAYLTKLLGAQKQKIGNTPYWQLGTVEDTGTWHQEFNYDNILDLIKEITSEHEDYYFTFDFSVFPWRLNLIARNDDVLTEFRASRNIASCKVTQSDKDQCTRLYLSITTKSTVKEDGKTAGKKSTVTFEVHDDAQGQAAWGVIEKTAGIETDKVPASEKAAWVQAYFDRHRDPNVQISISGYDLKEQTGEDIDEMHLARVCRAVLPRYNTTLLERIVEVTYPDALGQPSKVDVSMANKRQTTEDNIASAQKEAKKAGGGGSRAKQQAENNATEIEFQKIRYDLQVLKDEKRFAVIATESWYEQMETGGETLVGQYTSNVETTARKLTSAFNVTGVKLDKNGDPVIDEETGDYVFDGSNNSLSSQISQTAAEIRSEVTRATGAESSLSSSISQTAGEIRTEVSKKVDKNTYNSYVSQTATEIAAKVGKTDVSITDNGISITGVSGTLDISGLRTSVGALEADHVTSDSLDAVDAKITNLTSGATTATSIKATNLYGTNLSASNLTVDSRLGVWSTPSMGSASVDGSVFASSQLKLDHSHTVSASADSTGLVTITVGKAQTTNGTDSFNMAATTWYAGRVTAFKSAVSSALGNAKWNASGGVSIYASLDTANKRVNVTSATASVTYPGDTSPTSVSIGLGNLDVSTALDTYHDAAVAEGEGHFTKATVKLQGTAHAAITPIGTPHKFSYTHLYYGGSSVKYYQGNGSTVIGRGSSVSVTPIGTAHHLRYTKLYKTQSATAEVQWAYVSDSSGPTTWYGAGTAQKYYLGDGSTVIGRGDTVTVTQQGNSQWAYVSDSDGSTTYYSAGTQITGLYDEGASDSSTYYTKNT